MNTPLNVLLVEDSLDDAQLILLQFEQEGIEIQYRRVDTAEAFIAALDSPPDLILSDFSMPQFTGLQALKILREHALDIPFILVSGTIGEEIAVQVMKDGADDYLMKDRLKRLGTSIQRALSQKRLRDEKTRADIALRYSEARFRSLIENSSDEVSILSADGSLLYESPSSNPTLGYQSEEFLNKSLFELVHPDDLHLVQSQLAQLLQDPTQHPRQRFRLLHRDGRWIWVEAVGTNLLNEPSVLGIVVNYHDVTESVAAEEALRESEEQFRQVWNVTSDAMSLSDSEGIVFAANPAYYKLYGYKAEQVLGQSFVIIFPEDFREYALQSYKELFKSDITPSLLEAVVQRADGTQRIVESRASFLTSAGQRTAMLSTIRDITERKAAEEIIRNERNFSNQAIESLPGVFYMYDENRKFMRWNKNFETITGYTGDEIAGMSPLDFFADKDRTLVDEKIEETFRNGSAWVEANFVAKDGTRTPYYFTGRLAQMEGKNCLIGTGIDITERKKAEENNQRQLKHLQALRDIDTAISNSFDLKLTLDVLLDATLSQLEVSAASVLLLNLDTSTLEYKAGKGFYSTVIQQTSIRLGEGLAGEAALQNRAVYAPNLAETYEKFVRADLLKEEKFISYYGIPLVTKGKLKGVLEVFLRTELNPNKDWTDFFEILAGQAAIAIDNAELFENLQRSNFELERRVAERTSELHKTNLELEHANHAKDEFLANMSHELRTPLNSILGLSESMLEQYQDTLNENQQKSLQTIEASGTHLLDLINDILDLAKIEAGKFDYYPQSIHVYDLCKSCLIFVKTQAMKKNITLTYEIEDTISDFSADPRRLKQILVNLLTNAVKFTPNDGHVTLKINTNLEKDVIQFSVIDTGIGIAQDDLRKLFTPFVQVETSLNRNFEGTGLGLALVHKLTDLHGGSVEVESEVGKGSRFTINLPYLRDALGQTDAEEKITLPLAELQIDFQPKIKSGHQKILLVEDNPANILTIGEYLENHGYEIVIANDGVQAIEKAQEVSPDVILMDIQIPILDGLEATRRLRADVRFEKTPIIALTALAMSGDRERCLEAGATEYMSKPVSLKELRKMIENFLILK